MLTAMQQSVGNYFWGKRFIYRTSNIFLPQVWGGKDKTNAMQNRIKNPYIKQLYAVFI